MKKSAAKTGSVKVILGMTMSLDGYINDINGSVEVLYPDLDTLSKTAPMREAIRKTGAVVMGWKAYCMAEDPDLFAENYEFQVPIFVLTHNVPEMKPKETGTLTFTFVTDGIENAVEQAKAAAGDKEIIIIGGANTAQKCLKAGLADELHIDIMPVILGGGLRLFDHTGFKQVNLERIKVTALPGGRTHLRYRVIR